MSKSLNTTLLAYGLFCLVWDSPGVLKGLAFLDVYTCWLHEKNDELSFTPLFSQCVQKLKN